MSNYFLPIILILIIIYGNKKINVYDSFIKGCKEGLEVSLSIFPSILAIIFSSRILISSGFLDFILNLIKPILNLISFPYQILPMSLLRPISANSSLSIMIDIFKKYNPDSYLGVLSSVIQGCMDTTFYIISLYLGVVGINKAKKTLLLSILVNIIAIILSLIIVNLTF